MWAMPDPFYVLQVLYKIQQLAKVRGIEPQSSGLEPDALPLDHTDMAEGVGFEPTERLRPTVFKTAALSQTQPSFLILRTQIYVVLVYHQDDNTRSYCFPQLAYDERAHPLKLLI